MSRIESCACCRPALLTRMSSPAEALDGLVDQADAERLVAQVARDGERRAALGLDQLDDFARVRLLRRQVVDGDVRALASEGDRRGAAHTGITPGDQRPAAREAPRALVAGLPVVRTRVHLAGEARPSLRLLGIGRPRVTRLRILQRLRRRGRAGRRGSRRDRSRRGRCDDAESGDAHADGAARQGRVVVLAHRVSPGRHASTTRRSARCLTRRRCQSGVAFRLRRTAPSSCKALAA